MFSLGAFACARYPEGGCIIMPLLYYIRDGDGHGCDLGSYKANLASKTWGMALSHGIRRYGKWAEGNVYISAEMASNVRVGHSIIVVNIISMIHIYAFVV